MDPLGITNHTRETLLTNYHKNMAAIRSLMKSIKVINSSPMALIQSNNLIAQIGFYSFDFVYDWNYIMSYQLLV